MLPGETVMDGDEVRYPLDGDGWFDAIAFRGNTVTDVPNIKFRTYRPLPKKKKVKKVYTFDKNCYHGFRICKNGAWVAHSDFRAYAKLICDALNEMEERK